MTSNRTKVPARRMGFSPSAMGMFLSLAAVRISASVEQNSSPTCSSPLLDVSGDAPSRASRLVIRAVKRVQNISVAEFEQSYSRRGDAVPLVFENSMNDFFDASKWTRQAIAEECGHISLIDPYCEEEPDAARDSDCHAVRFKNEKLVGKSWAALEIADLDVLNIATMSDLLDLQDTPEGGNLYLHDAPLSRYCPSAMKGLRVPKYFPVEYRFLTDDYESVDDMMSSHPSIFISKKGASSMLHADSDMTRFWMMGLSGRKLWRVIPPSENDKLYPNQDNDYYPMNFFADVMNPDFEQFPKLNGTLVYETILEPGEFIFIPEGWAHQVLTLEDAISTSMNFVDFNILDDHIKYKQHYREENQKVDSYYNRFLSSFMMPIDTYDRADPEENINMEDFFRGHLPRSLPVPSSVKEWVQKLGASGVNSFRDADGVPALHIATEVNFISVVKYLLEEGGADINVKEDSTGVTALTLAKYLGYEDMQKAMLDHVFPLGPNTCPPNEQ